MTDAATAPRRIRPESAWDVAREEYLSGFTADEVCRRHDLGRSAFHARAQREGWRRADQPAPEPDLQPLDPGAPPPTREQAIDKVWRRAMMAIDAGSSSEAMRWMRVHETILAGERAEMREGDRRSTANLRAATRAVRGIEASTLAVMRQVEAEIGERQIRTQARTRAHPSVDSVDSKKPLDPNEPGLNRAERRRRRKLAG